MLTRIVLLILIGLFVSTVPQELQAESVPVVGHAGRKCRPQTDPPELPGENSDRDPRFKFWSDSDRSSSSGLYCLERYFESLKDHKREYTLRWMFDGTVLLRAEVKKKGDSGRSYISASNYSREKTGIWWSYSDSMTAFAYVGDVEKGAARNGFSSLVSGADLTFYYRGERFRVTIEVTSSISLDGAGRPTFRYTIRQSGLPLARVQWPAAMSADFIAKIKERIPETWRARREIDEGTPFLVEERKSLPVAFTKVSTPRVTTGPVYILSPIDPLSEDRTVEAAFMSVIYRP